MSGRNAGDSLPHSSEPVDGPGFWKGIAEVYRNVPTSRRRQFFLLLLLMLLSAVAELASIGAVVPFLSLLADPSGLSRYAWAVEAFDALGADTLTERLIAATAAFATFAILAGALRLYLTWYTQNFIYRLGHDLSLEIQRRILLQPYSFHIQSNSSTLLSAVNKTESFVFHVLLPVLQASTAAFISLFIIAALIYIDPVTALIAAAAFSLVYLLISAFTLKRLRANSVAIKTAWDERLKTVQESLGGIRDVIIDNSQPFYLRLFDKVNLRLGIARANTAFVSGAPRFAVEAMGMVIIALVALIITQREEGLAAAVPILGAVALGAQRLLPLLQQIYAAWSNAAGYRSVLLQILDLLQLPISDERPVRASPLPFKDRISLDRVGFSFPTRQNPALKDISLEVPRGASLALVGETGSGKSTLADLIMGLLEPDSGWIAVDGVRLTRKNRRQWQCNIAHVPQSIFLADTSIARNIALGTPDEQPDSERVVEAARVAQLHEFVSTLPDGYETLVGERGIRLSGGQRQRLGIARAIYKQAPVLILDEATSALDEATEAAVIEALHQPGEEKRTIIVIAHRSTSVAHCDIIGRLRDGRLVELSSAEANVASAH